MTSAKLSIIACLAVAATALASPSLARDGEAMTLGAAVAPPPGFVALCETSPSDCSGAETSPEALRGLQTWAGRARWTAVFAAAGIRTNPVQPALAVAREPTPAPAAIQAKPHPDRAAVRAAKDAARKAPARTPKKAGPPDAPPPPPVVTPGPTSPAPAVAPARVLPTLNALEGVNSRINRASRRSSDMDTFGAPDVWTAPSGPRARGDCEDYVLAKRRALIEAGVDPDLMSIALVRTRRGEAHAVLLVQTEDGEQVLDNLSPWVIRWDQAPYEWLERQTPGDPLTWVRPA